LIISKAKVAQIILKLMGYIPKNLKTEEVFGLIKV